MQSFIEAPCAILAPGNKWSESFIRIGHKNMGPRELGELANFFAKLSMPGGKRQPQAYISF